MPNYTSMAGSAMTADRRRGRMLNALYDERAQGFDPHASAQRATDATVSSMFERHGQDFRDLRGSQVGSGRLNTGFGEHDEGQLENRFMDRVGNVVAQNSLQASGLELGNIQGMGQMGDRASGRFMEMLAAERDREMMQMNARRQQRGGLLGTLGGIAGGALGTLLGPAGTAVGSALGSKVGGWLGGGGN